MKQKRRSNIKYNKNEKSTRIQAEITAQQTRSTRFDILFIAPSEAGSAG
jgi:hypothetical protein